MLRFGMDENCIGCDSELKKCKMLQCANVNKFSFKKLFFYVSCVLFCACGVFFFFRKNKWSGFNS